VINSMRYGTRRLGAAGDMPLISNKNTKKKRLQIQADGKLSGLFFSCNDGRRKNELGVLMDISTSASELNFHPVKEGLVLVLSA